MSHLHFARVFAPPALGAGWSGYFLLEALQRWRFERICAMSCGRFWEGGTVELIRGAMDWHTPLALATLPLVVCGAWSLRRARAGSIAAPRPRKGSR